MPASPPAAVFRVPPPAWRWLFWALVAAVTALMLVPRPPPTLNTGWDKLNHVLAFAAPMFAGLAAGASRARGPWLRLAAGLLAWGAALEVLQGWMPPRQASAADWLADAIGVLLGALVFAAVRRWLAARAGPVRPG